MNHYEDETTCWVYFCLNYPNPQEMIHEIWDEDGCGLADHIMGKFNMYYDLYGSYGVMNALYCNLSTNHQRRLREYAMRWGGML